MQSMSAGNNEFSIEEKPFWNLFQSCLANAITRNLTKLLSKLLRKLMLQLLGLKFIYCTARDFELWWTKNHEAAAVHACLGQLAPRFDNALIRIYFNEFPLTQCSGWNQSSTFLQLKNWNLKRNWFPPNFPASHRLQQKKWEEITDASQGLSEVMACGKLQLSFVGVIFGCSAHARPPSIPRNQNCVPVSFCGSAVLWQSWLGSHDIVIMIIGWFHLLLSFHPVLAS